jgi:hypothetical protein
MKARFVTAAGDLIEPLDECLDDEIRYVVASISDRTLLALDTAIARLVSERTGQPFGPRFELAPPPPDAGEPETPAPAGETPPTEPEPEAQHIDPADVGELPPGIVPEDKPQ